MGNTGEKTGSISRKGLKKSELSNRKTPWVR
jgi:hypothetical protein